MEKEIIKIIAQNIGGHIPDQKECAKQIYQLFETRVKELEGTIEKMKAIACEKIEHINGVTSVDYPSDNETEIQLQFAEQQIIGYSYGRSEPSITTLFDGMNLTKDEWLKIKDSISKYITPYDIKDIERYYKNK